MNVEYLLNKGITPPNGFQSMKRYANITLESRLAEYDKWINAGVAFPAVVALGKAMRGTEAQGRERLLTTLEGRMAAGTLAEAGAEAATQWLRAMQILSIGTKFDEDELLLVLTLRVQIELVLDVLNAFHIHVSDIDLGQVDAELNQIASLKENRRAFARALATMRRNSDVPGIETWLVP